jgi:glutamine synthetase
MACERHGYFEEKYPAPSAGPKLPLRPRGLLSKVVDNISKTLSIEFLVGFESEFLLYPHEDKRPIKTPHIWTGSLPSTLAPSRPWSWRRSRVQSYFLASVIDLEMYHAEGAKQQYEVVTSPFPPLEAVAALVHTRDIIDNVAHKHGLRAPLVPRLARQTSGNGA